jgi:hypothetical protein
MSDVEDPLPDWKSAESYRPLLEADPAVWAWEFGRRGQTLVAGDGETPADLCFVGEGPSGDRRPAVLWRWQCDPSLPVLTVSPAAPQDPHALDLTTLDLAMLVVRTDDGDQHVWVGDGQRRLRFAVVDGDVLAGPVLCQVRLPSLDAGDRCLESLRLLMALRDTGRLTGSRSRPPAKSARWLEILRAHDARRAGASQRDIALLLFGAARVRQDWSGGSDYMRMRVQRLVRSAEDLVGGGYRSLFGLRLLGGPGPRTQEVWRSAAWTGRAP